MQRPLLLFLTFGLLLGAGWYGVTAWNDEEAAALEATPERVPSEWGWLQRTFPHFRADPDAYRIAFTQARQLRSAAKTSVFDAWDLVGPTNIGGRIADVEFDPTNPSTIYAAAATGGVFKSTDAGQTWHPVFDDQPVLSIGDIAVDPTNTDILYVGTGEANGGHNNFEGSGLYKSTNGGMTWTFAGLENTAAIGRVLVDPRRPGRVFVAAVGSYFVPNPERGLYRSEEGGSVWEKVLFVNDSTGVIDVVMRPDSSDVLFAAAWQRVRRPTGAVLNGPGSGIYRSRDGGDTWARLDTTNGLPLETAGRIGLAICRDAPDTMYALFNDGFRYMGLYRTDDGGDTWFDADPNNRLSRGFGNFSWYFGQVRVDPENPDQVYVMDVDFMRTTDGGDTWDQQRGTHVDHHALAFHPVDPTFLVNGNDGGLALSQNGGTSWTEVADLPVTQFYEIGLDPSNPNRFYGGTQDNGTLRSDGPDDWDIINGGDGFYVLVDPTDPNIIYVESQRGSLVKIENGRRRTATSGISAGENRNWSTPVVMDPNDAQVLYYGTTRLYRTIDGTDSWVPISDNLTKKLGYDLIGTITTIAVAPTNSNVIYVGTDDGNVWVSDDWGATWHDVTGDLPLRWVTRVVVDPTDEHTAYVTYSGLRWRDPQPHVFRTTDMGASWENITADLPDAPVNAFAVDPKNPDYLYLGSDIGAFVSPNGGEAWEPLGEGLPAVSVYDMKIYEDSTQRFLVAGTHGRSMFTLDLSDVPPAQPDTPTALDADTPVPAALALESAFPNPFTDRTTLTFRLVQHAEVRLDVFDVLGRHVATLVEGPAAPGRHTTSWNAVAAASGTYLARLTVTTPSGSSVHATTMTLTR
ncbi:MAG: T9SS type A sorting domain-containing protein [Rhodothermales bacterium]